MNNAQDMLRPANILVLVTFYMPLIICIVVLSWGIIMQSVKGFIFILFVLAMAVVREFILIYSGNTEQNPINMFSNESNICNTINYSKHGNNTFSVFMLAFTSTYLSMPMFINSSVNWLFIGSCITAIVIDIGVRTKAKCSMTSKSIFTNLIGGAIMAMTIVSLMTSNGGEKFLFFNEIQSNKTVCSRPTKQQFKCTVYKNGEVLTNTTV